MVKKLIMVHIPAELGINDKVETWKMRRFRGGGYPFSVYYFERSDSISPDERNLVNN